MSTISGLGGSSQAWAYPSSSRADAMRDKMFAKVDSDGSGSVDATELQSMLDHISKATGITAGDASQLLSKMDSDGNGSLSQSELESGIKDLMPPPPSTMAFAQQRSGGSGSDDLFAKVDTDGDGSLSATEFQAATGGSDGPQGAGGPPPGGMPPPPPPDAASSASSAGSTSSSSSSTDPLDTNEDGVVSAQERAVGELKDLMKAMDSNGDGSVSRSEFGSFLSAMQAGSAATSSSQTADSASSNSDSSSNASPERGRFQLTALRDLVRSAYAEAQNESTGSTLSVAA